MKKYKFSEKLPSNGTSILCKVQRPKQWMIWFGIFNVFAFDGGIKLEANTDFIMMAFEASPYFFKIYEGKEIPAELIWWIDIEGEGKNESTLA